MPPQYVSSEAKIERSIIGEACEIYGTVKNSVIGSGVIVEEGAEIIDSIVMRNTVVSKGVKIYKAIVAENVEIGENTKIGVGEMAESKLDTKIYASDLATIGENSYIPPNVTVGKNTAISGVTETSDYPNGVLESGGYIIKAGEDR